MLSPPILKTIFYSNDVFFNSSGSLFLMTATLYATCYYSSNTIIPELYKYLVFYAKILLLNSAFYSGVPLLILFSVSLLKLLYYNLLV